MIKNLRNQRKMNEGITLIALVITIIVLLILAGISIATLTGENGILGKSQKASEETNKQTATEKINLKITNIQIATYTEKQQMPSLQDLANGLCNDEENEIEYVITKDKPVASKLPFVDTNGYDSVFTKLTEYPYEFEIDSDLKLASIDGVKIADSEINIENMVSKEEYNALLRRVEKLEGETKNINRAILMNTPLTIPVTTKWVEKDFGDIQLSDTIENYKYLEIQLERRRNSAGVELQYGKPQSTVFLATEQYNYNNSNNHTKEVAEVSIMSSLTEEDVTGIYGWFKTNKTLHIAGAKTNSAYDAIVIKKIYGIK